MQKLLFVYNAESSLFDQIDDLIHKTIAPKTYQCNLCALTYSGVRMRREWKEFINSLSIKTEFLHRDEFLKQYPDRQESSFPRAFIKDDYSLNELIPTEEINKQKSLEGLKALVKEKIARLNTFNKRR